MSTPELSWGVCDEAMPITISAMSRHLFFLFGNTKARCVLVNVFGSAEMGRPVYSGSVHARNRAITCQHLLPAHQENVRDGQFAARTVVPPSSAATARRNRAACRWQPTGYPERVRLARDAYRVTFRACP